jgi:transposase
VPNTIITNNGTNFTGRKFLEFANGYGIRMDSTSIGHPRTKRQVERANGMVLQKKLSHDMRLLLRTLLHAWSSYGARDRVEAASQEAHREQRDASAVASQMKRKEELHEASLFPANLQIEL